MIGNDQLFEVLAQDRAAEAAKHELELSELDRRRALCRAIEEVEHFQGPEEMSEFAPLWAPKWWEAGKALRTATSFDISELQIPPQTEYQIAANLLRQAIQGMDFNLFKEELSRALVHLEKDRRIWASRLIFHYVQENLRGNQKTLAIAEQVALLRLNPSEQEILKLLLQKGGKRRLTAEIAGFLFREPKSIGKNLSRLVRDGLVDNVRRHGYLLTEKGEKVAHTISQLSPKPRF